MRTLLIKITIAMVALFLAGCTLLETTYTVDQQKDFTQYRTYSWYGDGFSEAVSGLFDVDAARLDTAIRATIQEHMQSQGLAVREPDTADIWINYQATAHTTMSDRYRYSLEDMNQSYKQKQIRYSSSFDASRRYTTEYNEGEFVVDVIDAKNLQVVWRGIVTIPLGLYDEESRNIQRLQKAMAKMLKKFPPR